MKWGQNIWLQNQMYRSEEIQPTNIAAIQYKSQTLKKKKDKGLEVLWLPNRIQPMKHSYNVKSSKSSPQPKSICCKIN